MYSKKIADRRIQTITNSQNIQNHLTRVYEKTPSCQLLRHLLLSKNIHDTYSANRIIGWNSFRQPQRSRSTIYTAINLLHHTLSGLKIKWILHDCKNGLYCRFITCRNRSFTPLPDYGHLFRRQNRIPTSQMEQHLTRYGVTTGQSSNLSGRQTLQNKRIHHGG